MSDRGRNVLARTFTTLAAISLLAFGGVCVAWLLSYSKPQATTYPGKPDYETAHWTTFSMWDGNIQWMICHSKFHATSTRKTTAWSVGPYGMLVSDYDDGWAGHLSIHFYFHNLAVLTALLPALWIVLHRRRLRRARAAAAGLCSRCGYDLRASAERCPECGTRIPKASH
jgi:hypothetical protein